MPADVIGGELQTLISTLQNGNQQLSHLIKATAGISPVMADVATQLKGIARASMPAQMGAVAQSVGSTGNAGRLPEAPDGYITVDIPGVGPRLIPFYSAA